MKQCNCGSRFCKPKAPEKEIDYFRCPSCDEPIEEVAVDSRQRIFYTLELHTGATSSEEKGDEDTYCCTYFCMKCDEDITNYVNSGL